MKYIRIIVLYILLFSALFILGTVVMKLYDIIFKLNYSNIWIEGLKVGFLSWIMLVVMKLFKKRKKQ